MKKVKHVNYKAHCTYAPPIEDALINMNDIQSVTVEDDYGYRVCGPLVKVKFVNGETMICQGRVEDFYE